MAENDPIVREIFIEATPEEVFAYGASRERHEMGWAHYLGRLKTVATGGKPEPDPYVAVSVRHG